MFNVSVLLSDPKRVLNYVSAEQVTSIAARQISKIFGIEWNRNTNLHKCKYLNKVLKYALKYLHKCI